MCDAVSGPSLTRGGSIRKVAKCQWGEDGGTKVSTARTLIE